MAGAASGACLLLGAGLASAKPGAKAGTPKTKVMCRLGSAVQVPQGDTQLAVPVENGEMFGKASCGKLGAGAADLTFALQESGNVTGTFKQYYGTGMVKGKFVLQPSDSQPSTPQSFGTQSYTGTLKVLGGTAAFKGILGKGTITCSTPDSVHYACTEHAKVTLPAGSGT